MAHQTSQHDEHGNGVAHLGDEVGKGVELLAQGGGFAVFHLGGLKHFAAGGVVAHGKHTGHAVAFHHRTTFHYVVGGIGCITVKLFGTGGLGAKGLAGERRFVHGEVHRAQQFGIGGHLLAGFQQDDVAHHKIATGHLTDVVVAHHLHGGVVVDFVKALEGFLVLGFQHVRHGGCQQHGGGNAHQLEVRFPPFHASIDAVIERYATRKQQGKEQNGKQGIDGEGLFALVPLATEIGNEVGHGEKNRRKHGRYPQAVVLVSACEGQNGGKQGGHNKDGKFHFYQPEVHTVLYLVPNTFGSRGCKNVCAILLPAFQHLCIGESFIMLLVFHCQFIMC